jgi:hypothetical protein
MPHQRGGLPSSSLPLPPPSPSPDIDYILMQSLLNWHQDLPHHMPHHETTREDDALTARVQAFPLLSLFQVMVAARLVKDYNENRHVWGRRRRGEEGRGGGKRRKKRRRKRRKLTKFFLGFLLGSLYLYFHLSFISPPSLISVLPNFCQASFLQFFVNLQILPLGVLLIVSNGFTVSSSILFFTHHSSLPSIFVIPTSVKHRFCIFLENLQILPLGFFHFSLVFHFSPPQLPSSPFF